tara:strand:- start:1839 stop:2942 length:1104 start_codon:yes stop_codon:yes gene_type:complete
MIKRPPINLPWAICAEVSDRHGSLFPLEGWPLVFAAELETHSPGFLLHALGSKARWRQAFYVFLAVTGLDRAAEFLMRANGSEFDMPWNSLLDELGQCLRAMRPKDILSASLSEIPEGLGGALSKLGMRPMPSPECYEKLVAVLSDTEPAGRQRAKTLLQLVHLDANILDVVLSADPVALIPSIIPQISSTERVQRLNACLTALRSLAGASDEALRHSLEEHATTFRLHEFVQSWLPKVSILPVSCGLEDHPQFERVVPATAAKVGKRYRNCLATKIPDLLTGVWSAWIWEPGNLVVVLTAVEQGFVLSGVFAYENAPPPEEHAAQVREVLAKAGIICLNRVPIPDAVKPLLMRRWDRFELDDLEFA